MKQGPSKPAGPKGTRWLRSQLPAFTPGSFASNSMFTSARSLVLILAQLVFTPIIVKLYDPEAYGTFSLVFSLSTLLLSLFTLQYDKALLLPSSEVDIRGLRAVSNALPFYFSLLTFLVLIIARDPLLELLNAQQVGNGIYLIPLLVVLGAWAQTSQKMVQVHYRYRENFIYGSFITVGSKLTTIGYGLLIGSSFIGLALAEVFSRVVTLAVNSRVILQHKTFLEADDFKLTKFKSVFLKYISFPRYELPATALNAISNQIPIFWLPRYFGLAQLGQYSLAMGLLEMPMRLFGYSLSNTFYQKAARTHEAQGRSALAGITYRMMGGIAAASFLPLLAIGLFAEPVFAWIFGDRWAMSGALSSSLAMFYFARLVVEPVAPVLRVIAAQRAYFRFQVLLLILRVAAIGSSIGLGLGLLDSISLYSVANALGYGLLAGYIIFILRRP